MSSVQETARRMKHGTGEDHELADRIAKAVFEDENCHLSWEKAKEIDGWLAVSYYRDAEIAVRQVRESEARTPLSSVGRLLSLGLDLMLAVVWALALAPVSIDLVHLAAMATGYYTVIVTLVWIALRMATRETKRKEER